MFALQVTLALIELHLFLTQTVLILLEFLVADLDLFLQFGLFIKEFLLYFKQFVTLDG